MTKQPKVAIVADWLTNFAGAERVVLELHRMWPRAPIYTSIYNQKKIPEMANCNIKSTWLQKLPGAKNNHQRYIILMPRAMEELDLSEYDIVISSAHSGCSKGIVTKTETLHVCYCHTPPRYLWDECHQYIRNSPENRGLLRRWVIPRGVHQMRMWDQLAAGRVDHFVCNSKNVQRRIKKYYHREAEVINPPVDIDILKMASGKGEYFLALGRLIPYKKFDLVIKACQLARVKLKIVGDGPEMSNLQKMANESTELVGRVADHELAGLYGNCRAFIFPPQEDFGIVPLEAMGCGRPVIAYRAGGALETVKEGVTGEFFDQQTPESLAETIRSFDPSKYDPQTIRDHAKQFGRERFGEEMREFVEEKWERHCAYLEKTVQ